MGGQLNATKQTAPLWERDAKGELPPHARAALDDAPPKLGKGAVSAFATGPAGDTAIARGAAIELWSSDGKKVWSKNGGPFLALTQASEHIVGIAEDGALVIAAYADGNALGAIRLASTEPPESWRLATVNGSIVVLALGEWLVWIDARAKKTVRRVRAADKVVALAADRDLVVCALEGGRVQSFRAENGEPRSTFVAHPEGVTRLALGANELFTKNDKGIVRAWERKALDTAAQAVSPVTAVASRGDLVALGDRAGRVRIAASTQTAAIALGEPALFMHIAKDDVIVAASARVLMRAARPWTSPRPIVLKAPPTAFAADDAYSFVGTQTGGVDVYDGARAITTYALSSEDRITALVRLSGKLLVAGTGALDGRVLVVDVAEAKVLHRLSPHEEAFGVTCLAADPRGRIVASASDDGTIALIDPTKGRVLARLRVTETPVSLAFEPSGRRLACAFADGTSAIVTLTAKGATLADTGFRGVAHVVWTKAPSFIDKEGTIRRDEVPAVTTTTVAEA